MPVAAPSSKSRPPSMIHTCKGMFEVYGKTPVVLNKAKYYNSHDSEGSRVLVMVTTESVSIGTEQGEVIKYMRLSEVDSAVYSKKKNLISLRGCPQISKATDVLLEIEPSREVKDVIKLIEVLQHHKTRTFRIPMPTIDADALGISVSTTVNFDDSPDASAAPLWKIPGMEDKLHPVRDHSPKRSKQLLVLHRVRRDIEKVKEGLRGQVSDLIKSGESDAWRLPSPVRHTTVCAMHESFAEKSAFDELGAMFLRVVNHVTSKGEVKRVMVVCCEVLVLCDFDGNVKRMLRYPHMHSIEAHRNEQGVQVTVHPGDEDEELINVTLVEDYRNVHPEAESLLNAIQRAALDTGCLVEVTHLPPSFVSDTTISELSDVVPFSVLQLQMFCDMIAQAPHPCIKEVVQHLIEKAVSKRPSSTFEPFTTPPKTFANPEDRTPEACTPTKSPSPVKEKLSLVQVDTIFTRLSQKGTQQEEEPVLPVSTRTASPYTPSPKKKRRVPMCMESMSPAPVVPQVDDSFDTNFGKDLGESIKEDRKDSLAEMMRLSRAKRSEADSAISLKSMLERVRERESRRMEDEGVEESVAPQTSGSPKGVKYSVSLAAGTPRRQSSQEVNLRSALQDYVCTVDLSPSSPENRNNEKSLEDLVLSPPRTVEPLCEPEAPVSPKTQFARDLKACGATAEEASNLRDLGVKTSRHLEFVTLSELQTSLAPSAAAAVIKLYKLCTPANPDHFISFAQKF
eukprot:TRINITY_DN13852_c0_g3_i1.p1 TRINITY_DN13852_c0_g3~~TRINITY_DN13852_c0_g3_i1.p1  ORF type:complete len:752 (+),score=204.87 TRINITY_DN13852_c0_g3_i1:51-2258(+)